MPKFVTQPSYPDLTIVGSAGGAKAIPLAQLRINDDVASYETLFSFTDSNGNPMAAAYPGSYGPYLMAAGNPRA
jgi:hypothetical protein